MSDDILDLLERAPAPAMTIDPYAAVLGGRRRLRRRRAGFVGAGAAVVAVLATIGFSLVGTPQALVPAGSPESVDGSAAVLDFGDAAYTVRIVETGGADDRLEYGAVGHGGTAGGTVRHTGGQTTYGHGGEASKVILGVVPTGGAGLTGWLGPEPGQGLDMRRRPIAGTPYDAFALRVMGDGTVADLDSVDWQDAQGRWHTTDESDSTTAVFTTQGGEIVRLWVTPDGRSWGVAWGGMQGEFAGEPGDGSFRYADNGAARGGPGDTPAWGVVGLLPAGSRAVGVTARDGSAVRSVTAETSLGGYVPWFAELDGPGDDTDGAGTVERIAWTDKGGTAHEAVID